jgi:hypothetical protein
MLQRLASLLGGKARFAGTDRRYVFIVTYGRSGSTLLQAILGAIPSCHMAGENHDILGGLFRSWQNAVVARSQADSPRTAAGDPWRGAHLIDPDRFNRRLADVFVDEVLQPPAGTRIVGFKEVRYFDYGPDLSAYLDYIRMTFRPALLVFNRRSGEDVAGSAWWREYEGDLAAEVRAFDAATQAYADAHPAGTIVLNYDNWKNDPEELRPLFDRLEAHFEAAAVQRILDVKLNH